MNQWHDDTLVAIKALDNGAFKVVELPARQARVITSRRSFKTYEAAQAYIADQYPQASEFSADDLELERVGRQFQASQHSA